MGQRLGDSGARTLACVGQLGDAPAELDSLVRLRGAQDTVGQAAEFFFEVAIAHGSFDGAQRVLDVLLEHRAVVEPDINMGLQIPDPGIAVAETRTISR